MSLRNSYLRAAAIFAFALMIFAAARLALLLIYRDDFAGLSLAQVLWAFVYGLRFDASMVVKLIGLPLLFIMLPFHWSQRRWWQGLWLWLIFAVLLLLIVLVVGDLLYFGFVHRHVGTEITLIFSDLSLALDMLVSDFGGVLLLFLLFAGLLAVIWQRLFRVPPVASGNRLIHGVVVFVLFLAFVIVGRGGLQFKPVGVVDAFAAGTPAEGYLTLNGALAVQGVLAEKRPEMKMFMAWDRAVELARQQLVTGTDVFLDPQYPLWRTSRPSGVVGRGAGTAPNVVVLLFESWDAIHTDVIRRHNGLPSLGVTPNFDRLSGQGRLYSRFYAAGQRSMDGLAAILASMPTLPNMPYIGKGMEQNQLSYLGRLARRQGYQTLMLQSSHRGSFYMDSIAAQSGFNTYLGAEDIPSTSHAGARQSAWGVWDQDTLQKASSLFTAAQKPFLGFIFTSTTHNPWRVPEARWEVRPADSDRNRFLNTLAYADWVLGEFIEAAKAGGYYDNTIFVLTGDHISRFDVDPQDLPSRYHVPLLLVGPGIEAGVDDRVGSQLDILPTIADAAGWTITHASLGHSLLAPDALPGAFCVNGNLIDRIEADGWLSHDLSRRLQQHAETADTDMEAMQQRLLAMYQTSLRLQLENRLARPRSSRRLPDGS